MAVCLKERGRKGQELHLKKDVEGGDEVGLVKLEGGSERYVCVCMCMTRARDVSFAFLSFMYNTAYRRVVLRLVEVLGEVPVYTKPGRPTAAHLGVSSINRTLLNDPRNKQTCE